METQINETDNPLKRLVKTSIVDFAEWILKAEVIHVESANIELPADPAPIFSDLLFWVTLAETDEDDDSIRVLLHFEFQGRSSRKPMPLRVLDYLTRIADSERDIRIHSAVFYIGQGVGAKDDGRHKIKGIEPRITLEWRYDVIRLWQIEAEDLLALKRPGLLPLIGQTKIENPDELIPRVYEEIKALTDEEMQHRLLTELLALLQDEEISEMVETLVEQDEWFLDTPYIRRWRKKIEAAQDEAKAVQDELKAAQDENQTIRSQAEIYRRQAEEAYEKIRKEEEQRKELAERHRETRREDIINLVATRYNPTLQDGLRLQQCLSQITDDRKFSGIFEGVIRVPDFPQFYTFVEEIASGQNGTASTGASTNGSATTTENAQA